MKLPNNNMKSRFFLPVLLLLVGCYSTNTIVNNHSKYPVQFTGKDYVIRFSQEKSGWQTTDKSKQKKEHMDMIRHISADDLQKRYEQNNCSELHKKELKQEGKYTIERNCLFQSVENFSDQKEALNEGKSTFIIRTNTEGYAGSNTVSAFKEINNVRYYVHTENSDGDCGWWRVFETFIDNEKWSFYIKAGEDKSCSISGATDNVDGEIEKVDSFFRDVNISIENT